MRATREQAHRSLPPIRAWNRPQLECRTMNKQSAQKRGVKPSTKARLFAKSTRCQWCGREVFRNSVDGKQFPDTFTVDHVIRLEDGGTSEMKNLVRSEERRVGKECRWRWL